MNIHAYRRTEATSVELFGSTYLFAPNTAGHCVAEVADERAVHRLVVDIAEAYREYRPGELGATAAAAPVQTSPADEEANVQPEDAGDSKEEALLGSDDLPTSFEIADGVMASLGEVVAAAQARSKLDVEEWNLNDADDRDGLILAEVEHMRAAAAEKAAAEQVASDATSSPGTTSTASAMVVSNGEQSVDIGTMTAKQVREFAAQAGVELPKGNKTVGELRQLLFNALTTKG